MKLLVLANDTVAAPAPGMRDGYELLHRSGELEHLQILSWRDDPRSLVLDALAADTWDTLMIWSPRTYPNSQAEEQEIDARVAGRTILVWEGDHWNSHRIAPAAKNFWLPRAAHVFNSAGEPSIGRYLLAGAGRVQTTISAYDHLQFAQHELSGPPPVQGLPTATMIASNPSSWPRRLARPGAYARMRLASRLRHAHGSAFYLYGGGWPKGWSRGSVQFADQLGTLRAHSVSAIWDHYASIPNAVSNRLAISMLAGRPHVMSSHPGADWLGMMTPGVFMEPTVQGAAARVGQLLSAPTEELAQLGESAFEWARYRLDQRSLVRFITSTVSDEIGRLDVEPWATLRKINLDK